MDEFDGLVSSLHDHLAATAELPLEEESNRLLDEAQAIAGDVSEADLDRQRAQERLEAVADLLEEVDGTGDDTADEHVAAARRALERALER